MKEITNVSKSFTCNCGTTNRFEFETDFDVHDVSMVVKCQACGKERTIELVNFFRKHSNAQQTQNLRIDYNPSNLQAAFPSFSDIVADCGQQPESNVYKNQTVYKNQMPLTNDYFQQMNSTNLMDTPAQANAMNMFDEQAVNNYESIEQAQQPTSRYAGLLDLAQEHLDNVPILEDDEIYEPFKKENENTIFRQERQDALTQPAESLNLADRVTKTKDEEDDETFSALFGNF